MGLISRVSSRTYRLVKMACMPDFASDDNLVTTLFSTPIGQPPKKVFRGAREWGTEQRVKEQPMATSTRAIEDSGGYNANTDPYPLFTLLSQFFNSKHGSGCFFDIAFQTVGKHRVAYCVINDFLLIDCTAGSLADLKNSVAFKVFKKFGCEDPRKATQLQLENIMWAFTSWNPSYALEQAIPHIKYMRINDNPQRRYTMDPNLCCLNVYIKGGLFKTSLEEKSSIFQSPLFVSAQALACLAIMNSSKYRDQYVSHVRESRFTRDDRKFLETFNDRDLYRKVKDSIRDKRLTSEKFKYVENMETVNWDHLADKEMTVKTEADVKAAPEKEEIYRDPKIERPMHALNTLCQNRRLGYATFDEQNISETAD